MVASLKRAYPPPSNLPVFMHATVLSAGGDDCPSLWLWAGPWLSLTNSDILRLSNPGLERTGSLPSISYLLKCSSLERRHHALRKSKGRVERGGPQKGGLEAFRASRTLSQPPATGVWPFWTLQTCGCPCQHQVKRKTHQSTTDLKEIINWVFLSY